MGKRIASAAAALVIAGFLASANAADDKDKVIKAKPPYVHAVIFYLKKDAPKDEGEALIRDAHELLAKIPSVRGLWAGRPAEKATPEFAVTDYDVGLLVLFEDFAGLKTYLDHPKHTEYVERHVKHIERVPVYDFINKGK